MKVPVDKLLLAPRKGGQFRVVAFVMALLLSLMVWQPGAAHASAPAEWAQAVRLMKEKQPKAALPYLEGLVRAYPDVAEYRLELGYALFLLGRDGRAQYHFEQVRGAALNGDQRRAVDTLLSKITARKIWSVRLGFSIEPSSNAGNGTVASTITIGDLVFSIPESLRSKPATGAVLTAGITVMPRLSENLRATFSFDTLIRHYADVRLRETVMVGRAGLRWYSAPNTYLEGGVLAGRSDAAGSHHSDRYGVFAGYATPLGDRAFGALGVEHYQLKHTTFTTADGARTQINGTFSYAITGQSLLRARAFVLRTDANSALQSGWKGAVTLGGSHAFKGGLVTLLDVTAGLDKRDGVGGLTGVAREDKSLAVEAQFFNSNYKIGRFLPVLRMKYERNRSNIALNNYSSRSVSLGIRTNF